jgi:hypothetical protein
MAIVRHEISEHDVLALRAKVGDWPAGTEGTSVSICEDAALVELSGMPIDEPWEPHGLPRGQPRRGPTLR